jgi:hypothetical protein
MSLINEATIEELSLVPENGKAKIINGEVVPTPLLDSCLAGLLAQCIAASSTMSSTRNLGMRSATTPAFLSTYPFLHGQKTRRGFCVARISRRPLKGSKHYFLPKALSPSDGG